MILLTPAEAAEEFRVSKRTVQRWAAHGRLRMHPREDNERLQGGGAQGYRVERAQVAMLAARLHGDAPRSQWRVRLRPRSARRPT